MKIDSKIEEQVKWFEDVMGESPKTLVISSNWFNLLKKESNDLINIGEQYYVGRESDKNYYLYRNMLVIITKRPLILAVY